jgi:hypothetical protein
MHPGFILARLCFLHLCLFGHAHSWCQAPPPPQIQERFVSWIDTAPPGIKRLIDLGRVTFEIDDQELKSRKKQGLTRFLFNYRYRYRYRFVNAAPLPQSNAEESMIAVVVSIYVSDIQWSHRVIVGSSFNPDSPWKSRLLQHEFDHVSISTDPRLKVLLSLALGAPMKFEITAQGASTQENETLAQRLEEQISTRIKQRASQIERITQSHNDRFDMESNNGSRSITERGSIFADFFSAEAIGKSDLLSPELLGQYSKAIDKTDWKEHYLLNEPP